jgi:hypothetical protein
MSGFTFYENYYETLKKIRKRAERQAVVLAMTEFIFEGKEPENLSEVGEIVFQSFRVSLEKSRQNARNSKKTNEKRIENETQTKPKRNANELKTNEKRIPSFEERNIEDRSISPPLSPPKGGKTDFESLFFETYPKYAKSRGKHADADLDYQALLEAFGKSSYCRRLMSFTQVVADYQAIIRGDYADKPTSTATTLAGIEAKAGRERWYSERRAKAEREAEAVLKVFMQDETFRSIHKRLHELQGEIGRTEAKAQMGDDKAVKQLVKLTQEQSRLTLQYRGILERNGKTEEDLLPKWHCKKCKDTGWKEDDTACDCYEKESV